MNVNTCDEKEGAIQLSDKRNFKKSVPVRFPWGLEYIPRSNLKPLRKISVISPEISFVCDTPTVYNWKCRQCKLSAVRPAWRLGLRLAPNAQFVA